MIAILTGDIINSRKDKQGLWREKLKVCLSDFGTEPKEWEIFRGDSFQLKVQPAEALKVALLLKSSIKQIKGIDVRIAIGIGDLEYNAERITESAGSAFVYSGQCFDDLKKHSMAIRTRIEHFDEEMNLYFLLALLTINGWLPSTAKIVQTSILNENLNQKEITRLLNKSESTISEGRKRAGYDEIMKMEKRYRKLVNKYFITDKLNEK